MPPREALHASHRLEYPYSRSVGPVIGAFLTGLRDGTLLGVKGSNGVVIVPPTEYDPATGDDTGEMVEVGPGGVVESWAWVSHPLAKHPLFAALRVGADPPRRRDHRDASRRRLGSSRRTRDR